MPPVVVTYLGFPVMLALLVGVHLVVRKLSGRRRILSTSLGVLASYVTCVLFFFVALLGFGRQENTLRITVVPSSPASEAGLRDGDRVVAVNGAQPESWEDVRLMIADGSDAPIGLEVERGAQTLPFEVQPRDGRIGVMSIIERHELPLSAAAAVAIPAPVFTLFTWAREAAHSFTQPRLLIGPVGYALIAGEPSTSQWDWLWPLLFALGVVGAYAWPFSLLTVFLISRRRQKD